MQLQIQRNLDVGLTFGKPEKQPDESSSKKTQVNKEDICLHTKWVWREGAAN